MITFTLSVVIALLGLIGLAIGYFLGYRTGYVDGTEDAAGVEDAWVASKAEKATQGYPSGHMVGGYQQDPETLGDIAAYLEKLEDCDDGQPNEAMKLLIRLNEYRDVVAHNPERLKLSEREAERTKI